MTIPFSKFVCCFRLDKIFRGVACDVFSVSCFDVRVSVMFHFMFVHYILIQFGLLSGNLLGNSCPVRLAICSHCILFICNIYLFPVLVLREGFAF